VLKQAINNHRFCVISTKKRDRERIKGTLIEGGKSQKKKKTIDLKVKKEQNHELKEISMKKRD
jgi:hypothetical protein